MDAEDHFPDLPGGAAPPAAAIRKFCSSAAQPFGRAEAGRGSEHRAAIADRSAHRTPAQRGFALWRGVQAAGDCDPTTPGLPAHVPLVACRAGDPVEAVTRQTRETRWPWMTLLAVAM